MVDRASDTAIEARLNEFLSAERGRAEADYPHLLLRTPGRGRTSAPLGLAVLAAVLVAAVVLVRPWAGLQPAAPGADPLGTDGIPLSIAGQPVLRGTTIDSHLADGTSLLAGGYLVLHPTACDSASPTPSAGCAEDWRLEDAAGGHSLRVTTVAGGATFVRTSGAATVFHVRPVVDEVRGGLGTENRRQALLIEATVWRQPTKGRIPEEATPPDGGEINMALVPDFVSVWGGPTGETIAGYVPKDLLLNPRSEVGGTPENPPQDVPMPVYGEDLTTLVGHMVAGVGFVPLGESPAPSAAFGSPSAGPSADPWGPLAVAEDDARDALDAGTGPGRLIIGPRCVTFQPEDAEQATTLIWRSGQTRWDPATAEIVFDDPTAGETRLSDRQRLSFGGAAVMPPDAPDQGAAQPTWLRPPEPSCPGSQWVVHSIYDIGG